MNFDNTKAINAVISKSQRAPTFHYSSQKKKKKKSNSLKLRCCCWMQTSGNDDELKDDAYLVVAGEDLVIHVISVKRCKVIIVLKGHESPIIDLVSHPVKTNLLLSLSEDGNVKLWNIHAPNRKPLQELAINSSAIVSVKRVKNISSNFFLCS